MKKKNLTIFLQPVILTLFGTLLGIFLRDYFTKRLLFEAPQWLIILLITLMIFILALIFLKVSALHSKQENTLNEIKSTINGMYPIDADSGMGLILSKIKTCTTLKIIGVGRQDVIEKLDNNVAIEYLKAIERRAENKSHFILQRITGGELNNTFKNHLETLLRSGNKNKHEIAISVQDSIQAYITYVIVDSSFLIVNITTELKVKIRDARLNFYTYDKDIIRGFTEHFEEIWQNKESSRNLTSFKNALSIHKNKRAIELQIAELAKSITTNQSNFNDILSNLKELSTIKIIEGPQEITNESILELKKVSNNIRTTSFKYKVSNDIHKKYYHELAKVIKAKISFNYKCCYNLESFSFARIEAFDEANLSENDYLKMKHYPFENQFYFNFVIFDDTSAMLGFPTSNKVDSMHFVFKLTSQNILEKKIIDSLIMWYDNVLIPSAGKNQPIDYNQLRKLGKKNSTK